MYCSLFSDERNGSVIELDNKTKQNYNELKKDINNGWNLDRWITSGLVHQNFEITTSFRRTI